LVFTQALKAPSAKTPIRRRRCAGKGREVKMRKQVKAKRQIGYEVAKVRGQRTDGGEKTRGTLLEEKYVHELAEEEPGVVFEREFLYAGFKSACTRGELEMFFLQSSSDRLTIAQDQ
jgi:hypothetical protein